MIEWSATVGTKRFSVSHGPNLPGLSTENNTQARVLTRGPNPTLLWGINLARTILQAVKIMHRV